MLSHRILLCLQIVGADQLLYYSAQISENENPNTIDTPFLSDKFKCLGRY